MFDASWDRAGRMLVQRAIERHGGASAWRDLGAITSTITCGGLLLRVKRIRELLRRPRTITVDVHAAVFEEFPAHGSRGVYDRGDVRIEGPGGIVESVNHRRTFASFTRKLRRWSALDALYFFGYAFTSYLTFPFGFASLHCVRTVRRGALDAITMAFPRDAHVHSRVQTFYLDSTGLIVRNDYVAEIAGAFWRGAHTWEDPVTVGGITVPTRRRVVPRLGHVRLPFPAAIDVRITESRSVPSVRAGALATPADRATE
jgi:hypothetical protein